MSIAPQDAPQWPLDAMTAGERRGLRALDHDALQDERAAFVADIAEAKAKRDARQRQAERARNPFHLTDKGVSLLLVWPSTVIGAVVLLAAVAAFLFTDWR